MNTNSSSVISDTLEFKLTVFLIVLVSASVGMLPAGLLIVLLAYGLVYPRLEKKEKKEEEDINEK